MMTDKILEAELDVREAESALFKITQEMVSEKIGYDFLQDILDKVEDGWDKAEALDATLEEYGYHLKSSEKKDDC